MPSVAHEERARALYTKSIPQLFLDKVQRFENDPAFFYKKNGIYREVTWGAYRNRVKDFCLGLISLGLEKGERVAFMGDTCPEYFIGDLAALCAGAVTYGIYATCSEAETEHQVNSVSAKLFIAENQEYVDKILARINNCPLLERIVVADKRAMFNYDDPRIISFAEVEELGRQLGSERKSLFLDRVNDIRADELAIFVFTSGTTGAPKAAMHSHRDVIVGQSHAYLEGYPELERRQHRLVTHLPLAHLVERSIPLYLPLISDIVVYFGEDVETLPITLFEVMPTFFHGVPRIWEKLASQFLVGIERSSRFKRLMFNAATRMGESYISHVWKGKPVPLHIRVGYSLSKNLVFRPMLMKAGLSRLEAGLTAGGPISDRVQRLWQMWGVNLRNIYGITEGTVISCQSGDFPPPGDAGPVVYPKEVRLGADGEVLVRGRGLFLGYYRDEAATQAALEDGWLKTGDIAQWVVQGDKTVLKLVDRKKDLMITKGGKNISPSEVETCLKSSPYISEAILFADNRKYPAALIEIDFDTVAEWARQRGISYNGFASLATSAPVDKLITEEIEKANRNLARVEQVKKFRIIPKELDPEEGGTTPTRKVKRKYIYEMFRDTVEGMFDKDQELDKAS